MTRHKRTFEDILQSQNKAVESGMAEPPIAPVAPQDRQPLLFSTHDVSLSGWRLREFLRLLREGKVAAVKTGPTRYADLHRDVPYVATIAVRAIKPPE